MLADRRNLSGLAGITVALILISAASGAAFAGWLRFGEPMLLALAERGLSYCN